MSRSYFFPFICLMITVYFIFHGIAGNHGIKRMREVQEEIQVAKQIQIATEKEKALLQSKVNALSPKTLDMDQLEESALRILNMGDTNDRIILR